MFIPLPTPQEMGIWDKTAMERFGIPGIMLMENASRAAFDTLHAVYGDLDKARCLLVAGPGNNGGDAFALGRHLYDAGAEVLVAHTKPRRAYKREAGQHLRLAARVGTPMAFAPNAQRLAELAFRQFPNVDIVVDGLLGTGLVGQLKSDILDFVRIMNELAQNALAFAIDIPSGLNGTTGRPSPDAFLADATATFETAKLGLLQPGADIYVGKLHICPIGIPRILRETHPTGHRLATDDVLSLRPVASSTGHKGSFGHVLVVGGSPGLTGAPFLAALGALRTGAGLVSVACPEKLGSEIKHGSPEIMLVPLPGQSWQKEHAALLHHDLHRFGAVVLGPGIGRTETTFEFVKAFLELPRPTTIIDADGLYFLADSTCPAPAQFDVITPHPLEAARLLGHEDASLVQADRASAVRDLAGRYNCTCLLKGAGSLVNAPGKPTTLFPFSHPCLAVGGSGDVLSGIMGALRAQGVDSHQAALLGTYLHGCAGERLEGMFPCRGNLARDIADALPSIQQADVHTASRDTTIEENRSC